MTANVTWQPGRYLQFVEERTRPALELLGRVPLAQAGRIADLGCGPGNSTALLRQRWPEAALVGIDSSAEMLKQAASAGLDADWQQADLASWRAEQPFDLLFSNATFQWLDDHQRIFPQLIESLAPNGVLAIQMPRNFDAPSHRLLAETAAEGPWSKALAGVLRRNPVSNAETYYDLVAPLSAQQDIWETTYHHVLSGPDPVLSWMKGTALRPVYSALDETLHAAFDQALSARLSQAYPVRPEGRTLFAFRRIFMVVLAKP